MVLLAIFAGVVAPYDPTEMKVADALKRPSLRPPVRHGPLRPRRAEPDDPRQPHRAGRRAVEHRRWRSWWARSWGWSAATSAAWPDLVIGRAMDVLFSFPTLILAIGIAAMLGPGLDNAALAIAVVYAPLFSRVVRGPVIAERAKEHAAAALGLGAGTFRVVLPPHPAQRAGATDRAGLGEPGLRHPHRGGALSYLGLGTQPPAPSWGTMLNEGRTYLETAPWMSIFPGLAIMLAVLGFNLLGDGLRSALDHYSRPLTGPAGILSAIRSPDPPEPATPAGSSAPAPSRPHPLSTSSNFEGCSDRQLGGLGALENLIDEGGCPPPDLVDISAVRDQATGLDVRAVSCTWPGAGSRRPAWRLAGPPKQETGRGHEDERRRERSRPLCRLSSISLALPISSGNKLPLPASGRRRRPPARPGPRLNPDWPRRRRPAPRTGRAPSSNSSRFPSSRFPEGSAP